MSPIKKKQTNLPNNQKVDQNLEFHKCPSWNGMLWKKSWALLHQASSPCQLVISMLALSAKILDQVQSSNLYEWLLISQYNLLISEISTHKGELQGKGKTLPNYSSEYFIEEKTEVFLLQFSWTSRSHNKLPVHVSWWFWLKRRRWLWLTRKLLWFIK